MTWVILRQHRWQLLLGSLLLAALAAVLLTTGGPIHEQAMTCGTPGSSCPEGVTRLPNFALASGAILIVALALPAAAGMFVGAPLLAHELEQRTHEFAWTQSITRQRWLLAKLGLLAAAVVALSGLTAAVVTWWERPFVDHELWNRWDWFDHGLPLPAYALFSFALGVAAGTIARRTVPAMAVTIVAYAAARFGVAAWRTRFRPPVEATVIDHDLSRSIDTDGAWLVDWFIVDGRGQRLTPAQETELFGALTGEIAASFREVLARRGLAEHVLYHPAERLVPFQLLEAGIFVAAAALLIGLAVWWARHRAT